MKDLIKDIIRGFFFLFSEYPLLTCLFSLFIFLYLILKVLPKAYKNDDGGVYAYYQKLSVYIFLTLFFLIAFIIQLIKVIQLF
jgi:hypothetical protein